MKLNELYEKRSRLLKRIEYYEDLIIKTQEDIDKLIKEASDISWQIFEAETEVTSEQ